MADPQTSTPTLDPNPNAGLGFDDSKMKDVTGKLADIKRSEISANDKVYNDLGAINAKIPKIEAMSQKAGVEAEKMKPWNEAEESKKRESDPIQNFASLGSVFGILASAFTHAPMENAMNASAAAMNAIKAGNAEDYNRAYKAWQDNTKQAMDRHAIEHEAFQDAVSLLHTNMEAANTKLRINAARFGDQKALALLDAGMDKELLEYQGAKQKLHEDLVKNMVPMAEANAEMAVLLNSGYNSKNPADPKNAEALKALAAYKQDMAKLSKDPTLAGEEGQLIREFSTTPGENGKVPSAEERKNFIKDLRTTKQLTIDQQTMATWDEEHPNATAAERAEFSLTLPGAKKGAAGSTSLTGDRQRAADVAEMRKQMRAEKNEDGSPKYTDAEIAEKAASYEKHLKTAAAAPSGNKVDDIKSREGKIDVAEGTINKIDEMLLKHKAIAGIGGKITRTSEAIGNILGSNATDRAQFRRWVLELQETLPSVINDRNGRPISSEAAKIEGIVAGLAAGDTNANTLRAYDELRPLLKTIKGQLRERRGETSNEPAAPKAGGNPWERDPEVK